MKYQKRTWFTIVFSSIIVILVVLSACALGAGSKMAPAGGTADGGTIDTPREGTVEVSTAEGFMNALSTARDIRLIESITLSEDFITLENLNTLVIEEGVKLTITSLNFIANCDIVNHGEILVDGDGRMIFDSEPDYSQIGNVYARGEYAEILFSGGKISVDNIVYFLINGSLFNSLYDIGTGEILIDRDLNIPAGKRLWINDESFLHVAKGVTLTNNGKIECMNEPVVDGKIDGKAVIVYGTSRSAGFTTLVASSTRTQMASVRYHPDFTVDGDPNTAWCEGVDGPGIGEWIEFRAEGLQEVKGIRIMNGYCKSNDLYYKNNAVKSLSIQTTEEVTIPLKLNPYGFQTYTFDTPVQTNILRLTIKDVYRGSENGGDDNDTLISEIEIF